MGVDPNGNIAVLDPNAPSRGSRCRLLVFNEVEQVVEEAETTAVDVVKLASRAAIAFVGSR
jgi:hypothetical protein